MAARTPSAIFSTIAGRPMSSGRIGALMAVPMARRAESAGPVSSLLAKTVACGVSTPSQPPDQTMGISPISASPRVPCLSRTPRKAVSDRMRVKSLTPPLPSVLPITATISSAAMRPDAISSSRPEASETDLISTFATSIAMSLSLFALSSTHARYRRAVKEIVRTSEGGL